MRLIDADALFEKIVNTPTKAKSQSVICPADGGRRCGAGWTTGHAIREDEILNMITDMPTAYDVEKVLEKLDERCRDVDREYLAGIGYTGKPEDAPIHQRSVGLFEAIGIVKSGGVENE